MSNLETLRAAGNALTGQLPDEIWYLAALTTLDLSNNRALTGRIDDNVG